MLLIIILTHLCSKAQQVMPLYSGAAPGLLPGVNDIETSAKSNAGNRRLFVTNVTVPTLTVYLPGKQNTSRTAVIICPGGGYSRLSIEDGGYEAAQVLADSGIIAVVLKYRTWRDSAYTDYKNVPLQDLQQAMALVYENSAKWNIDTSHIGILGFSAGGHLTAMAATGFKIRKPAFTILAYPVISFLDSLTSGTSGSRRNLLGKKISLQEKIAYSPELHISGKTPPSFIVHAKDDSTSLVGNSIAYYKGLLANNISARLLLYEKGGHGFALYNKEENAYWMPAAISWLVMNG
ncbi:MAG: alpha/beta hydrolase, partial [Chitinophagaceae bacterium]